MASVDQEQERLEEEELAEAMALSASGEKARVDQEQKRTQFYYAAQLAKRGSGSSQDSVFLQTGSAASSSRDAVILPRSSDATSSKDAEKAKTPARLTRPESSGLNPVHENGKILNYIFLFVLSY